MGRRRCRVDVSVDGRFVAAGSGDGAVFVWDESRSSSGGGRGSSSSGSAAFPGGPAAVPRGVQKDAVIASVFNSDVSALVTADKGGVIAFWSLMGQQI